MCINEETLNELRIALLKAKEDGTVIELITAATPPAGRPPNIRGVVQKVNCGTLVLELTSGPPNRKGIYSIPQLIGFVPASDDEE
ncbi:hypothetical protein F0342_14160 [Bacillus sp. CH30_1T]|uniref:hypothetical protein n=1 Tax=Bacillus sp. CH30_1T TaxID=2604836 RepID=UPI0011EFF309|nr:hypothetical protein [Bacillus sp. CH30_1T]KAA0563160.1 hypothetical protein F0342_14160 [Bacillus sp. CH30_1T]